MPVIEPNGVALPTIGREDQERCEELLERWMVALNSYDAPGMKSVMRFPHVRLAENRLVNTKPTIIRWICSRGCGSSTAGITARGMR
jgi:hypothetical protein